MGHIHIGFANPDDNMAIDLVRYMDLYLGVPSVIMDSDLLRKKVYGTAGRFRITSYGVEYRVLSNFWLASEELMRWAFSQTQEAIKAYNRNLNIEESQGLILNCINNSNTLLAEQLIKQFKLKTTTETWQNKTEKELV